MAPFNAHITTIDGVLFVTDNILEKKGTKFVVKFMNIDGDVLKINYTEYPEIYVDNFLSTDSSRQDIVKLLKPEFTETVPEKFSKYLFGLVKIYEPERRVPKLGWVQGLPIETTVVTTKFNVKLIHNNINNFVK